MTEEPKGSEADYLVRVKAQVMTRDDSTGGWVPMGGGGLSEVGLRKLCLANGEESVTEYLIYGQKITDKTVVLHCILKKDIQYTKANPTFHHWKTDEKRYGLTFERSADARAFDVGIKKAITELVEDCDYPIITRNLVEEDDVFMALDLPLNRKGSSSQSASTTSTTTSSPSPRSPVHNVPIEIIDPFMAQFTHPHANHHHLHRVHYITKPPARQTSSPPPSEKSNSSGRIEARDSLETSSSGKEDVWVRVSDEKTSLSSKSDQVLLEMDSSLVQKDNYVFIEKKPHEYSYPSLPKSNSPNSNLPTLESLDKPPTKRDSMSSIKKTSISTLTPQLPTASKKKKVPTATLR